MTRLGSLVGLRHHVISLTAIFTAIGVGLAVGTVAGTAALPTAGQVSDPLRPQVDALTQHNQELQRRIDEQAAAVDARDAFVEQLARVVLSGRLAGVEVLIVSAPGAESAVDGVATMLTAANASIVGRVAVTDAFLDPVRGEELSDLARRALPAALTGLPLGSGDGAGAGSALLAAVLLPGAVPVTDTDRRSVLAALTSQGFVTLSTPITGPAEAVVVVSGPPAAGPATADRTAGLVSMVTQLDRAGPVVVVGTADVGIAEVGGGLIARLRADAGLSATISTVDNGAIPPGSFVAAWALVDQMVGRVGHYGTGPGTVPAPTTLPLVPPPPTPTPTPTPSPSPLASIIS